MSNGLSWHGYNTTRLDVARHGMGMVLEGAGTGMGLAQRWAGHGLRRAWHGSGQCMARHDMGVGWAPHSSRPARKGKGTGTGTTQQILLTLLVVVPQFFLFIVPAKLGGRWAGTASHRSTVATMACPVWHLYSRLKHLPSINKEYTITTSSVELSAP